MYVSKSFLVSIYLYISIANASILARGKACVAGATPGCRDGSTCDKNAVHCTDHFIWHTCYCSSGHVDCWC